MAARYRFGGVDFDSGTGELRPLGTRLPRLPSQLLSLLVEKRGGVVTHDEIRSALWSDTTVEYDKSLHFCVHQIRSALGESASDPRFVETIPRQGYRLIPEVETVEVPAVDVRATWSPRWLWASAGLALLALAGWLLLGREAGTPPTATAAPLRVGVMPFEAPSTWSRGPVPTTAEWILEELTLGLEGRAWIVGPTTTAAYDRPDKTLAELAADYDLDYIVNGRFLADAEPPTMLAELIRTSDGAHLWVQRYEGLDQPESGDGRRMGLEISGAVIERLLSVDHPPDG